MVLGLFELFLKNSKMGKIEQKVKANPLTFWSISANISTFSKRFKNHCKIFWSNFNAFLVWFRPFSTVFEKFKNGSKWCKKLRLTPYHFGRFWPIFQLF